MSTPARNIPPELGSSTYLQAAREVVEYMRGLGIAASNRPADVARYGEQELQTRFGALDAAYMEALSDEGAGRVKKIAAAVLQSRAGNCEDQANLAFDLLAKRGVRPLELMALVNPHGADYTAKVTAAITRVSEDFTGPDHAFVVINRRGGSIMDPSTWNAQAVICDAWAKRAYYASWFTGEMALLSRVSGDWTTISQRFELTSGAW